MLKRILLFSLPAALLVTMLALAGIYALMRSIKGFDGEFGFVLGTLIEFAIGYTLIFCPWRDILRHIISMTLDRDNEDSTPSEFHATKRHLKRRLDDSSDTTTVS